MATLREYFMTEAADFLGQLTRVVQSLDGGSGNAAELQRHSRGLRGTAQMAREDRVYRTALALESATRSVAAGALTWSQDISERVRRTLEDIEALVKGGESQEIADVRMQRSIERWRDLGIMPPDPQIEQANTPQMNEATRQFLQFAAHEVAGIMAEMEVGIETLAADPRNRDPIKAILRRERALLGAARLEQIVVVGEALRATEDVARVIAKINVAVKDEWLNVFRAARDVLKGALESLQRAEIPAPSPALSALRVKRQELLDRYGEGDPISPATGAPVPTGMYASPPPATSRTPATPATPDVQPQPAAPTPAAPKPPASTLGAPAAASTASEDAVPIETLQYSGERALQRALELQPQLVQLATRDDAAREQLEELFDLIRLGIS